MAIEFLVEIRETSGIPFMRQKSKACIYPSSPDSDLVIDYNDSVRQALKLGFLTRTHFS